MVGGSGTRVDQALWVDQAGGQRSTLFYVIWILVLHKFTSFYVALGYLYVNLASCYVILQWFYVILRDFHDIGFKIGAHTNSPKYEIYLPKYEIRKIVAHMQGEGSVGRVGR